jgi:hypothetical protein
VQAFEVREGEKKGISWTPHRCAELENTVFEEVCSFDSAHEKLETWGGRVVSTDTIDPYRAAVELIGLVRNDNYVRLPIRSSC